MNKHLVASVLPTLILSYSLIPSQKSYETQIPIRVIRGPTKSPYAPSQGYRYDGMYKVTQVCISLLSLSSGVDCPWLVLYG